VKSEVVVVVIDVLSKGSDEEVLCEGLGEDCAMGRESER